jgi:hypothetical protein
MYIFLVYSFLETREGSTQKYRRIKNNAIPCIFPWKEEKTVNRFS